MPNHLLSFADLRQRYQRARTSVYLDVAAGLLPPAVSVGPGSRRFLAEEIDMVVAARAAGFDDDRIRALVRELTAARQAPDPSAKRAEVYAAALKAGKH